MPTTTRTRRRPALNPNTPTPGSARTRRRLALAVGAIGGAVGLVLLAGVVYYAVLDDGGDPDCAPREGYSCVNDPDRPRAD
ncbi:hypothetical protein [Sporichthya brevicatena]